MLPLFQTFRLSLSLYLGDDHPLPPPPGHLVPLGHQPRHHGHRGEGGARGLREHQRPASVVTSALQLVKLYLSNQPEYFKYLPLILHWIPTKAGEKKDS